MPFPVIPVVVASGITALVTYVGVRMAMDDQCECPHDDTKRLDETAREDEAGREAFYKARRLLEVRREKTRGKLESLGRQKAGAFASALIPFEETFSRIRNVDLGDAGLPPVPAKVAQEIAPESSTIREVTARMSEVVAGGVDAIGPDALAALAACGSAGVRVPASGGSPAAASEPAAASGRRGHPPVLVHPPGRLQVLRHGPAGVRIRIRRPGRLCAFRCGCARLRPRIPWPGRRHAIRPGGRQRHAGLAPGRRLASGGQGHGHPRPRNRRAGPARERNRAAFAGRRGGGGAGRVEPARCGGRRP